MTINETTIRLTVWGKIATNKNIDFFEVVNARKVLLAIHLCVLSYKGMEDYSMVNKCFLDKIRLTEQIEYFLS